MNKRNEKSAFEVVKNILAIILICAIGYAIYTAFKKFTSQNLKENIILCAQIFLSFVALFIFYKPVRRIFKPQKLNSKLLCIFSAFALFIFELNGCIKIAKSLLNNEKITKLWFLYLFIFCIIFITVLAERHSMFSLKELDLMEGHDFEYACAEILKANKFKKVRVTQGSGDYGIDILCEKDKLKYAVQCKCYSRKLDNKAIQEAHTGMAYYGCNVCAVMTNQYFTEPAKRLAETIDAQLWDRDTLTKMISHKKKSTANDEFTDTENDNEDDEITDEQYNEE